MRTIFSYTRNSVGCPEKDPNLPKLQTSFPFCFSLPPFPNKIFPKFFHTNLWLITLKAKCIWTVIKILVLMEDSLVMRFPSLYERMWNNEEWLLWILGLILPGLLLLCLYWNLTLLKNPKSARIRTKSAFHTRTRSCWKLAIPQML